MAILSKLRTLYKRRAVRSVAIYTFTNFLGKGVAFVLLFVFTNPLYITPSENGLLTLFSNSILLLLPFLSMGIVQSTGTEFFKMDNRQFRDLFTSGIVMALMIMILSAVLLYFFRETLKNTFQFPPVFVWLIPLMAFLIFCNEQLLNLARNRNDTTVYLKANLSKIALDLGISLLLVVGFAWHWKGRATGLLVAYLIIASYAIYYFIRNEYLFGRVRKKYVYSELMYAVPIIALQIGTFCMGSSDRFFLAHFTDDSNETVGIYNVAATFGSIIIVLCTALLQFLFPRIYSELAKKTAADNTFIKRSFLIYGGIMLAGTLLILAMTPVAYHYFINERYHSGLDYVYILCAGYFLWTISWFFFSFLLYYKEKRKILFLSCSYILISLLINYFFIREWNVWGAALANISTYAIVLIITLTVTRSYWSVIFDTVKNKNISI